MKMSHPDVVGTHSGGMWAWWSCSSSSYPVHYWSEASFPPPKSPAASPRYSRSTGAFSRGERTEPDRAASAVGGRRRYRSVSRRRVAARKVSGERVEPDGDGRGGRPEEGGDAPMESPAPTCHAAMRRSRSPSPRQWG
jgi:hypothetical protein